MATWWQISTHTQRFAFFLVCLEMVCWFMNACRWMFRIFHSLWMVHGLVGGLFCVLCDWVTQIKLFIISRNFCLFVVCSSMATLNCILMQIKGVPTHKSVPVIYLLSFCSVNGMGLLLLILYQFHNIAILLTSCFQKEAWQYHNWKVLVMDSNSDGYCSKQTDKFDVSEKEEENKVEGLEPWWLLAVGTFAVKIQDCPSIYLSPQGCQQKWSPVHLSTKPVNLSVC